MTRTKQALRSYNDAANPREQAVLELLEQQRQRMSVCNCMSTTTCVLIWYTTLLMLSMQLLHKLHRRLSAALITTHHPFHKMC